MVQEETQAELVNFKTILKMWNQVWKLLGKLEPPKTKNQKIYKKIKNLIINLSSFKIQ